MADSVAAAETEIRQYVQQLFGVFADLVGIQTRARPRKTALICGSDSLTYRQLDEFSDRIAAGLQRAGVKRGSAVAICAAASITYVAVFIGALRAGAAVSPLSPSATPEQLLTMLRDSGASHLFIDEVGAKALGHFREQVPAYCVALEDGASGEPFRAWLLPKGARPQPVAITPEQPFNIIYSSGTTGAPKGIVQSHGMRWPHLHPVDPPGYGPDAVAIISTPLYSNTTLVSLLPALAGGGTVVLMPRFDPRSFLELSERHRVTVAMLVPVQYGRILDVPDFDRFDLSSYRMKYAMYLASIAALLIGGLGPGSAALVVVIRMTSQSAPALGGADRLAEPEFQRQLLAEAVGNDLQEPALLDEQPFEQVRRSRHAPMGDGQTDVSDPRLEIVVKTGECARCDHRERPIREPNPLNSSRSRTWRAGSNRKTSIPNKCSRQSSGSREVPRGFLSSVSLDVRKGI